MVCTYCGCETQVINSRLQKRLNKVWRRRKCQGCNCVITTLEGPDFSSTLLFKSPNGHLEPFQRDKLFLSVYDALKHRKTAQQDATALTDTVIAKLLGQVHDATLLKKDVIDTTSGVLKNFDKAAATSYVAFHS